MNLTVAIGKSIRYYRLLKGIKLETLAKQIEVSKATMSQIENGQVEITISRIEKIARALDIQYATLVTVSQIDIAKPAGQNNPETMLNTHFSIDKAIMERVLTLAEEVVKLKTNFRL